MASTDQDNRNGFCGSKRRKTAMASTAVSAGKPEWLLRQQAQDSRPEWLLRQQVQDN